MGKRGGARPGAGRKRGVPDKKTQALLKACADGGEMPLEYMLRVMRDPTVEYPRRDDMAKAASAYCHPKLSTIDHGGKDGGALVVKIVD